jgi:hypothetical protein
MPRRIRAILLLVAIICQALTMFSPLAVAERAVTLEHIALHSQDARHHHHDDDAQAVHMDEVDEVDEADGSDGAVQHVHADAGFNTAGLVTTGWATVATVRPLSPSKTVKSLGPSPHLEGPLRPPQRNA